MKQHIDLKEDIAANVLSKALDGHYAHVKPESVLEGLTLNYTGKKILNTPYTIWQCLKHINYWQDKFIRRINGEVVETDISWKEGWEEKLNACSQQELDLEIEKFIKSIRQVKETLKHNPAHLMEASGKYENKYLVIQTMASHISYHIGEIVLLRRIFGSWPPKSGGMVW